ncbi:MAG: ABC transporter substrate-binding protein [Pseudomonadota bacterium]
MNRRETLQVLLALGAAIGPLYAGAQQPGRVRRIGVLIGFAENDPESRLRLAAFKEGLAALGWTEGHNLRIDIRWSAGDVNRASAFAKELVAMNPEVILSSTTPVTAALHRETRTIPIVFTAVSDPIGSGFVETLARPGGNITGFLNFESSLVEKWLQLLKEIAPRVTRAAVMFNPQTAPYADYYLQPLKAAAPKFRVTTFTATVRSESDIEKAISGLGREPGGGLLVMPDSFNFVHRKSIIALTARHKVPAIFYTGVWSEEGGLFSYGVDIADLFRRAAPYVDRILRGAKPAELPVQQPSKFEMVVNRKTAEALGLKIPQSVLLRADRVIE